MGTRVVGSVEAFQERGQVVGAGPDLRGEPVLKRTDEAFRAPIRFRPMPGDKHMDEAVLIGKLGELVCRKVCTAIRDEELKIRGEQGAQRGNDQSRRDLGTGEEERQPKALARTIVGEHKNSQSGPLLWEGGEESVQVETFLMPEHILFFALRQDGMTGTALRAQSASRADAAARS